MSNHKLDLAFPSGSPDGTRSEQTYNNRTGHPVDINNNFHPLNEGAQKKPESAAAQLIIPERRQVAWVSDRLSFLLYLAGIVPSLVFLFPKPPAFTNDDRRRH